MFYLQWLEKVWPNTVDHQLNLRVRPPRSCYEKGRPHCNCHGGVFTQGLRVNDAFTCCQPQARPALRIRVSPEDLRINMSLHNVTPGAKAPEQFNVIIEIPMNADPIKYEVDKETGAMFVDRFMTTAMHYPCNYGYIPQTLSDDGDPVDVLVVTPFPLTPGVVVTCRAVGVLMMEDEAGGDAKLLAVPIDKVLPMYTHWQKPEDVNKMRLNAIQHFFEHYKDLEPGKWVKVQGWQGPEAAKAEIVSGIEAYQKAKLG
jgi:inorganic pyrophosphatase